MNITPTNNQPKKLPVIEVKEISLQKAHLIFAGGTQATQPNKELNKKQ